MPTLTPLEWAQLGAATAALAKGASWLIGILLEQSKETITELREDRNFWRDKYLNECGRGSEA